MAAVFDTATTAVSITGTTQSGTHTPGAAPTLVLMSINYKQSVATVVAASYAATAMTLVAGPIRSSANTVYLYKLESPPAGAQTWSYTLDRNSVDRCVTIATFTGSLTASALRTAATATGSSTAPSVAVTSVAGDLVWDVMTFTDSPTAATPGADQTQAVEIVGEDCQIANSTETAAGVSTTMSWTLGASRDWATIGVAIIGVTLESVAIDVAAAATVAIAVSEVANEPVAIGVSATTGVAIAASITVPPPPTVYPIEPCRVEVFA